MRFLFVFALFCFQSIAISGDTYAQAIECGREYTVKSGDTLEKIARRAYGRGSAFQLLFNSNRDKIDRQDLIHLGQKLRIPCPTEKPAPRTVKVSFKPVEPAEIELLTASDYAPFTDEKMPQRGMLAELMKSTLEEANRMKLSSHETSFRIDFINDWSKHLTILMPLKKYDVAFPWYKPDCSQVKKLTEKSALRCKKYYFSDFLHESVISYFSLKEKKLKINTIDALKGKVICRPNGYFTFDLEIRGLVPPDVTLLQPDDLDDCFEKLADGEVQVVTMNTLIVDNAIKRLGLNDKLRQHPNLATIETLHAVVLKTHPQAQSLLLRINRGLSSLKASGDYDKIVEKHLTPLLD